MKIQSGGGGPKVLPKAGIQLAVCYGIIELGTQTKQFAGKPPTTQPLVQFMFELPHTSHVFDQNKGPQPLALFQEYSLTDTERSKLPKVLKSWGGMEKTPKVTTELIKKYLGQPCMITVELTAPNAQGVQYANIQGGGLGITQRMKEFPVPENYPRNERLFLDLDNFDWVTFLKLAPFLQEKIKQCKEWPSIVAKYPMPAHLAQQTGQQHVAPPQNLMNDANNGPVISTNYANDSDNPMF